MTVRSMRHVHILGAPRSGTTLLLEMMRSCYRWDWAPENETTVLAAPADRAGHCLTKNPGVGSHVRSILRDPRIWLVYCQRDPRDIVCSQHGLAPGRYWANLRQWRQIRRRVRRAAGHPRLLTVRYEDLVRDPDAVQRMMAERIPWLEQTGRFSQFHAAARPGTQSLTAMRGLRPADAESIGRWRDHLPRLAGQIIQHGSIADELMEDGYETDDAWTSMVSAVVPDLSPGVWPDRHGLMTWARQWTRTVRDVARLSIRSFGRNG